MDSMWQTARAAPVIIPYRGGRRASIVFSLDGLRPCSDQRPASRQKATSGCEGTGLLEPKQDSTPSQPSQPSPERKCAWLWLKRHGGPAAPDSGCIVGKAWRVGCMRLL